MKPLDYTSHSLQSLLAASDGAFLFDPELEAQLGSILSSAVLKRGHRAVLELVDPVTGKLVAAMERYATPVSAGLAAQHPGFLSVAPFSSLALRKRSPVLVPDLPALLARRKAPNQAPDGQTTSIVAVPVVIDGEQVGVLSVASAQPGAFGSAEQRDLVSYAAIASGLLKTRRRVDPGRTTAHNLIRALVSVMEAKYPEARPHLFRVEEVAVAIAARLHLSLSEIQTLRRAAWLHDLGKIGVNDDILLADRRLHPRELDEVKKYPAVGEKILSHLPELSDVVPVVRHHHEHWDGSGYPDGLAGDDIPLLSRIVLVAEAYDAITSDRPYRRARSQRVGLREIHKEAARQFCPRVAHAFLDTAREGELVEDRSLSDIILSHF